MTRRSPRSVDWWLVYREGRSALVSGPVPSLAYRCGFWAGATARAMDDFPTVAKRAPMGIGPAVTGQYIEGFKGGMALVAGLTAKGFDT